MTPQFHALEWFTWKDHGPVAVIHVDPPQWKHAAFKRLKGKSVLIDGQPYSVRGVNKFDSRCPISHLEILVEEKNHER